MIKQKIADLQAHHDRAEKAEKALFNFFDECTYNMKLDDEMEQVYKTISILKDLQKRYKAEAKAIFTEYNNEKPILTNEKPF